MNWFSFIRSLDKYYDPVMWQGVGKFHLNDLIKTKLPEEAAEFHSTDLIESLSSWSETAIGALPNHGELRDKDRTEFCSCMLTIIRTVMCLGLATVVCTALHVTDAKLKFTSAMARFEGTPTLFVPNSQGELRQINLDDCFVTPNLQITEQIVKALCEDGNYRPLLDASCSPDEIGLNSISWCRAGLRQCISGNKTLRTLKDVYKDLKEIDSEYNTGLVDAISI